MKSIIGTTLAMGALALAAFCTTQSQRMIMKHSIAVKGTVNTINICNNGVEALSGRCQFGHSLGGSTKSNIASIRADRIALAATPNRTTLK